MHSEFSADAAAHLASDAGWIPLPSTGLTREALEAYVATQVARMLHDSPERLVQLLYRLDVAEQHLHDALRLDSTEGAAKHLAQQIVARELQKAESRRRYAESH